MGDPPSDPLVMTAVANRICAVSPTMTTANGRRSKHTRPLERRDPKLPSRAKQRL
jgi:hypothetical protein